jgi:hypothetical protein
VKLHSCAIAASVAAGAELYIIHPGYTPWSFGWRDALLCLDQSLAQLAPLQEELGIIESLKMLKEWKNPAQERSSKEL